MSIKCRRVSVLWRDICDFFLSFRRKTAALLCLVCSFPRRERMFIFESRLFLEEILLLFFHASLYFFFAVKQAAAF